VHRQRVEWNNVLAREAQWDATRRENVEMGRPILEPAKIPTTLGSGLASERLARGSSISEMASSGWATRATLWRLGISCSMSCDTSELISQLPAPGLI